MGLVSCPLVGLQAHGNSAGLPCLPSTAPIANLGRVPLLLFYLRFAAGRLDCVAQPCPNFAIFAPPHSMAHKSRLAAPARYYLWRAPCPSKRFISDTSVAVPDLASVFAEVPGDKWRAGEEQHQQPHRVRRRGVAGRPHRPRRCAEGGHLGFEAEDVVAAAGRSPARRQIQEGLLLRRGRHDPRGRARTRCPAAAQGHEVPGCAAPPRPPLPAREHHEAHQEACACTRAPITRPPPRGAPPHRMRRRLRARLSSSLSPPESLLAVKPLAVGRARGGSWCARGTRSWSVLSGALPGALVWRLGRCCRRGGWGRPKQPRGPEFHSLPPPAPRCRRGRRSACAPLPAHLLGDDCRCLSAGRFPPVPCRQSSADRDDGCGNS